MSIAKKAHKPNRIGAKRQYLECELIKSMCRDAGNNDYEVKYGEKVEVQKVYKYTDIYHIYKVSESNEVVVEDYSLRLIKNCDSVHIEKRSHVTVVENCKEVFVSADSIVEIVLNCEKFYRDGVLDPILSTSVERETPQKTSKELSESVETFEEISRQDCNTIAESFSIVLSVGSGFLLVAAILESGLLEIFFSTLLTMFFIFSAAHFKALNNKEPKASKKLKIKVTENAQEKISVPPIVESESSALSELPENLFGNDVKKLLELISAIYEISTTGEKDEISVLIETLEETANNVNAVAKIQTLSKDSAMVKIMKFQIVTATDVVEKISERIVGNLETLAETNSKFFGVKYVTKNDPLKIN